MCNRDEAAVECTPHFVFLRGLAWLRGAFSRDCFSRATAAISPDDKENACLLKGLDCPNWRSLLDQYWYFRDPQSVAVNPEPATFVIATIVEHYALKVLPRSRCALRDFSQEALLLCAEWKFWLCPDIRRYHHAVSLWKPRTMSSDYDPSLLLGRVLKTDWCSRDKTVDKKDTEKPSHYSSKEETTPPAVVLLRQRVDLGVKHNSLEEARDLCLKSGREGNVWNKDSSELLELVASCLSVLKAGRKDPQLLHAEFVAVTIQALLSTNWLQICGASSKPSQYAQISCTRHPRKDGIGLLGACADEWNAASVNTSREDLKRCIHAVSMLSESLRHWTVPEAQQCDECRGKQCTSNYGLGYEKSSCCCSDSTRVEKRQRLGTTKTPSEPALKSYYRSPTNFNFPKQSFGTRNQSECYHTR